MKFPGSKLLHQWDLAVEPISLDDLVHSCRQSGLTGFAELRLADAIGLIFYYLGGEVNAIYRERQVAHSGQVALERLRARAMGPQGTVSIYELPLDMAHLLRGVTGRRRLRDRLGGAADLAELLARLEKAEHTGTLEVQTSEGSAMLLLVRGRLSNVYFESRGGLTFEKGEARQKLDESLAHFESTLFLADFSRDVWKSRHAGTVPMRSRLEKRTASVPVEQIAREEGELRADLIEHLVRQLPSVLQAFVFDLMTGSVYLRRGRGAADVQVAPLARQVPVIAAQLRQQVAISGSLYALESFELVTAGLAVHVAIVPEAQEAIAVLSDRSQPATLIESTLAQAARAYAARLHPARGKAAV
jgi:hypothetical protein